MTAFLGKPVEDLSSDDVLSLARFRDRADAYAFLRKASVPFLEVDLVVDPNSLDDVTTGENYVNSKIFFEAFRDGGMPKPMDFPTPWPSELDVQIEINEDVRPPIPAVYGKGSEYVVLKQLSRARLIADAQNMVLKGRHQKLVAGDLRRLSIDLGNVTEDDAEAIRRSRLTVLLVVRVLHELLEELLDYRMQRVRNPLLKSTNVILELHQARYPEADVFEHDKIEVVQKRVTAFLHYNDDAEQWLADDKTDHTNDAFKEWQDELPFDNDIINAAITRSMYVWVRENPLKCEIEPFVGIVGHAIRGNLRLMREKTPLADNGGKPLSIRRMAERLGTKPINLSRLETGKKSALYPIWIRQYASVLGCKEVDLFPAALVGLINTVAEAAKEGPVDQELTRQLPGGGGQVHLANEQEERLLELNRRLFEEREVEFRKVKEDLETALETVEKKNRDVNQDLEAYQREMVSKQADLDEAKHSSMKLMEEIIQLRKENENAFAEHEGKPVRNNLPVYGRAFGGQFSDVVLFNDAEAIDWVGMPYNLAGVVGAFAVMCSGNSMSPKYENGDILHIHPDKRIRRGHYIVVEWDEGDHRKATIGRYLNAVGNKVTVEKLNPATTVDFTFRRMFRIVGMTEAED